MNVFHFIHIVYICRIKWFHSFECLNVRFFFQLHFYSNRNGTGFALVFDKKKRTTFSDAYRLLTYNHLKLFLSFSVTILQIVLSVGLCLRPSQSNGVMSSAVCLSNHTFTGQA